LQDAVEALGELVKEGFEVALLGDSFADFQKRFQLSAGVLQARRGTRYVLRIRHEIENSTRFAGATTGGAYARA